MKYENLSQNDIDDIVSYLIDKGLKFYGVLYVADKFNCSKLDAMTIVNKIIDEYNIKFD